MSKKLETRIILIISAWLLLTLALPLAFAKDLHSDWHYSGDSFSVGNEVILVTHYDFYDTQVILDVNDRTYIIDEGSCKFSPTREYCIDDIYQNLKNSTSKDPVKFEDGKPYAGIKIIVRARGPDLSVSRVFSTTSPELGSEASVSVTIKNQGSEGTDSLLYQETFPAGIILTSSSSGTERSANTITYNLNVPANSEKTFTYSFKALEYLEFTSTARINYTYAQQSLGIKSSDTKIKVKRPYDLILELSPNEVEPSDQAALSVKITNAVSGTIKVSEFKIQIPSLVSVQTKSGELELKNMVYYWNGSIETGQYRMFNLLLKPKLSGKYSLRVDIKAIDPEDELFIENKTINLSSKLKALEPILSISDDSLAEGSWFRIAFSVKNPNKYAAFKNIKSAVKSELFAEQAAEYVDDLPPEKTKTVLINDTLEVPYVNATKKFIIEAFGTYETSGGELLNFSKKLTLTVTPVSKAITIMQSPDKKKLKAGENITINVDIKNNNAEAIQVEVQDSYSEGAALIGGKTSGAVSFTKAETQKAYTYNLNIPNSYDKTWLLITTTATILGKNFTDSKALNISVNITKPFVANKTSDNKTAEPEPAKKDVKKEEKPGFFNKVFDALNSFFKRLLGTK